LSCGTAVPGFRFLDGIGLSVLANNTLGPPEHSDELLFFRELLETSSALKQQFLVAKRL
jgi:hypothetical protein